MKTAADVMQATGPTVGPDAGVRDLAKILDQHRLEGVCVVDDDGRLVGVVTGMDLVYREKRIHLPTLFAFLDGFLPIGSLTRSWEEIRKITAANVGGIMSPPVTVSPDTPLEALATQMVDKHFTMLPVVDGDKLVGVVTKSSLIASAFSLARAG